MPLNADGVYVMPSLEEWKQMKNKKGEHSNVAARVPIQMRYRIERYCEINKITMTDFILSALMEKLEREGTLARI